VGNSKIIVKTKRAKKTTNKQTNKQTKNNPKYCAMKLNQIRRMIELCMREIILRFEIEFIKFTCKWRAQVLVMAGAHATVQQYTIDQTFQMCLFGVSSLPQFKLIHSYVTSIKHSTL
jgi:hypothetical protein